MSTKLGQDHFFQSPDYDNSLISRIRDTVGSHYKDAEVTAVVAAEVKVGALLESTVAEVGGLARMADPIVRAIMAKFNGGDVLTTDTPAIEEQSEALVDIPPLVILGREAVEEARRRLRGQDTEG